MSADPISIRYLYTPDTLHAHTLEDRRRSTTVDLDDGGRRPIVDHTDCSFFFFFAWGIFRRSKIADVPPSKSTLRLGFYRVFFYRVFERDGGGGVCLVAVGFFLPSFDCDLYRVLDLVPKGLHQCDRASSVKLNIDTSLRDQKKLKKRQSGSSSLCLTLDEISGKYRSLGRKRNPTP